MRVLGRAVAAALCFCAVLLMTAPSARAAGGVVGLDLPADTPPDIRIVYETLNNPPQMLGEGTGIDWDKPGLTLELLRLIAQRLDVAVSFERMPWARGLYLMEHGDADAIFHASYKPDRLSWGVYPTAADGRPDPGRSIFNQAYVFYVVADSPVRWDGERFTGLSGPVGATKSYSVVDDLKALDLPVEEAHTNVQNLDKLIEGRISVYADLQTLVDPILRKAPDRYRTVVKLTPPFRVKPYYLVFSRAFHARRPDLAEAVWNAIPAVTASDDYQALIHRYATAAP